MSNPAERRRYFRIDDQLSLQCRSIEDEAVDSFAYQRDMFSIYSTFLGKNEKKLPLFKVIEKKYSDVAEYLQFMDEKINSLAKLFVSKEAMLPDVPTHNVNLSAQGMRFFSQEDYQKGGLIEMRVKLFPSRIFMMLYARVVSCIVCSDGLEQGNQFLVSVDYEYIHDEDREAIIKHTHKKQLRDLHNKKRDETMSFG
ncbi:MAG: PilZ domain-containing protein [Gammaproteobacteria bacterium]|nr:PilZ domain-containing protein [Gammaproteobacteria bacterium]